MSVLKAKKAFFCEVHNCDFTGFTNLYCAKCVAEEEDMAAALDSDEAFADWKPMDSGDRWVGPPGHRINLGSPRPYMSVQNIPAKCPTRWATPPNGQINAPLVPPIAYPYQPPASSRNFVPHPPVYPTTATPIGTPVPAASPSRPMIPYSAEIYAYNGHPSPHPVFGVWHELEADVVIRQGSSVQEALLLIHHKNMLMPGDDYVSKYLEFFGNIIPPGSDISMHVVGFPSVIMAIPTYVVTKHKIV